MKHPLPKHEQPNCTRLMPGHAQRGEAAEALRRILTCPEHSPCSQAAERLTLPGLPSWLLRRPYWADSPASQRYTKDVKGCGRIVSPGVKSPAKRGFRGTPRASPRLRRPIRHDKTFRAHPAVHGSAGSRKREPITLQMRGFNILTNAASIIGALASREGLEGSCTTRCALALICLGPRALGPPVFDFPCKSLALR